MGFRWRKKEVILRSRFLGDDPRRSLVSLVEHLVSAGEPTEFSSEKPLISISIQFVGNKGNYEQLDDWLCVKKWLSYRVSNVLSSDLGLVFPEKMLNSTAISDLNIFQLPEVDLLQSHEVEPPRDEKCQLPTQRSWARDQSSIVAQQPAWTLYCQNLSLNILGVEK